MKRYIRQTTRLGGLCLVVVPAIKCDKGDMWDTKSALETITSDIGIDASHVGLVHGRMPNKLIEPEIERTRKGKTKVLITTSMLECGIHLPRAECALILDADRFGAAQLYQLRGRIGRVKNKGNKDRTATCVLYNRGETPNPKTKAFVDTIRKAAKTRIQRRTGKGLQVAITDTQERGPGVMDDEQPEQHGYTFAGDHGDDEVTNIKKDK